MHPLRPHARLSHAHALDERHPHRGAAHLCRSGFHSRRRGTAPLFRQGSRRAELGSRLVSRERRALAAAAATGVQVGAAMVATRFAVQDFGPAALAFLRYLVALLCLVPFLGPYRRVRFAPRDLIVIMLLGAMQFGLLIALLN